MLAFFRKFALAVSFKWRRFRRMNRKNEQRDAGFVDRFGLPQLDSADGLGAAVQLRVVDNRSLLTWTVNGFGVTKELPPHLTRELMMAIRPLLVRAETINANDMGIPMLAAWIREAAAEMEARMRMEDANLG